MKRGSLKSARHNISGSQKKLRGSASEQFSDRREAAAASAINLAATPARSVIEYQGPSISGSQDIDRHSAATSRSGVTRSTPGGARTVIQRLRERLEQEVARESQPFLPTSVPPDWLLGRPCPLDLARCVSGVQIGAIKLELPFVPLQPQLAVAERVLQACERREVALVESPTGTGKSIALLSAAIGWQREIFASRGAAPQIIYAVRTHAQLAQIVSELKKTPYRPRMAVIGSRDQLCINNEVRAKAQRQRVPLNLTCRQAARRAVNQSRGQQAQASDDCVCTAYAHLGHPAHSHRVYQRCGGQGQLWDVEELLNICNPTHGESGCPYYTAHVLAGGAEIVFCPHNYVLDPAVSQCKSHHRERWSLTDRIVIIDEAHNVEQGCRDAGSVVVSLTELRNLTTSLGTLASSRPHFRLRSAGRREHLSCREACALLQELPGRLATFLAQEARRSSTATAHSDPLPGLCAVWGLPGQASSSEFARDVGLSGKSGEGPLGRRTQDLVQEFTDRLLQMQATGEAAAQDAALLGVLERLNELLVKFRLLVDHPFDYVVGISTQNRDTEGSPSLAAWLMSPGILFDTFAAKAHAVVLASGTLSPMAALRSELASATSFSNRSQPQGPLEAAHVVAPVQVAAMLTSCFPNGQIALCTYDSWRRMSFLEELGNAIAVLIESIPGGVLCFLPSYAALEACVAAWRSTGSTNMQAAHSVWVRLERRKGVVVVEPRRSDALVEAVAKYTRSIREGTGALCLAVYRGKMSEGLNFEDDFCRGVICIGVPYPQAMDPVVLAKRQWNDAQRASRTADMLSGEQWYELQAYRSVNQALGRCLRHRYDYGVIVLLDARWASRGERARGLRKYLPKWLQPFVEETNRFSAPAGAHLSNTNVCISWMGMAARLRDVFSQAPRVTAENCMFDGRVRYNDANGKMEYRQ